MNHAYLVAALFCAAATIASTYAFLLDGQLEPSVDIAPVVMALITIWCLLVAFEYLEVG